MFIHPALRVSAASAALGLVLAASAVANPPTPPPSLPNPVAIEIKKELWQALPNEVQQVFLAPDKRTWFIQRVYIYGGFSTEDIKKRVAEQFNKPAPQIAGVRPVLFEKSGRVWFVTIDQRLLLGYDGKTWIERKPCENGLFSGGASGHGRHTMAGVNYSTEAGQFFIDSCGVHRFDGKDWTYQEFVKNGIFARSPVRLIPTPDGKSILATAAGNEATGAWRFADGKWTRIEVPEVVGAFSAIASDPQGRLLFLHGDGQVTAIGKDAALSKPPENFDKIIKDLGDPDFKTREAAAEQLAALGPAATPFVKKAYEEAATDEVKWRLEKTLETWSKPTEAAFVIGSYVIKNVLALHTEPNGTLLIPAKQVVEGDKDQGAGLIVLAPNGNVSFFKGDAPIDPWRSGFVLLNSGPVSSADGRYVWIGSSTGAGFPCGLDLAKRTSFSLPDNNFGFIQAVADDGTVYASFSDPVNTNSNLVMVFQPGQPDTRNLVKAQTVKIIPFTSYDAYAIASDGALYAQTVEHGLARFDGKSWKAVEIPAREGSPTSVMAMVPGRDGSVLVRYNNGRNLFVHGTEAVEDDDYSKLLASQKKAIADAFGGGYRADYWPATNGLAVDKDGHIWLLQYNMLTVLIDDKWTLVTAPAPAATTQPAAAAGPPAAPLNAACVLPVGDGSRVLILNSPWAAGPGYPLLAKVTDGKPELTPLPRRNITGMPWRAIYDADGSLVLDSSSANNKPGFIRVSGKGEPQRVEANGMPLACDKSGLIWVARWDLKGITYELFDGAKSANSITVPHAMHWSIPLSDKPGSIYLPTATGLVHLTASKDEPAKYQASEVVHPVTDQGMVFCYTQQQRIEYSPLGFIVSSYRRNDKPDGWLYIIPIAK